MSMFGDWSGVGNWWDQTSKGIGTFIGDVVRASAASPGNPRGAIPTGTRIPQNIRPNFSPNVSAGAAPSGYGDVSDRFSGNVRQSAASMSQMPQNQGMSQDELLAWILGGGGGGGGGGVDLSGYNTMLGAIDQRESGLNERREQQEAFLTSLYDAAEGRAQRDKDALAAAVEAQLASDATRRATEVGLIRGADAARQATADAARGALGTAPGADISAGVAQNVAGGIGASGSVSERDARINQAIAGQQYAAEIAGLTPMEQMSRSDLMRGYEDRLSALAGERAAIQAQIAQARASARGSGGPSVSERLAALNYVEGLNQGPAGPAPIGGQAILQAFVANDPANSNRYGSLYNAASQFLNSYAMNPTTGKMFDATELANAITTANPGLVRSGADRDFLQQLVKDYLG